MLAFALPLLAALAASPSEPEVGTALGQRFPDLELPLVDGSGSLRLSDLRGRRMLLIEFASW